MIWVHIVAFVLFMGWAGLSVYMAGKKIPASQWEVVYLSVMMAINAFFDAVNTFASNIGVQP